MTAKAPLTICCVAPLKSVALASDIFFAGSKAIYLTNLGASGTVFAAVADPNRAIDRILAALGARKCGEGENLWLIETPAWHARS